MLVRVDCYEAENPKREFCAVLKEEKRTLLIPVARDLIMINIIESKQIKYLGSESYTA